MILAIQITSNRKNHMMFKKHYPKVSAGSIAAKELSKVAFCPRSVISKTTLSNSDKINMLKGDAEHLKFENEVKKFAFKPILAPTINPTKATPKAQGDHGLPKRLFLLLIIFGIIIYSLRLLL